MYGQILIIVVMCALGVQMAKAGETPLSRASLPLKQALYEQWQGNYAETYRVAEYYKTQIQQKAQQVDDNEHNDLATLVLVQAAASLEMGFLAHGRELIDDLDERSLLPENQSRLHLYLARDAYRRRDWPLLNDELARFGALAVDLDNRQYTFLQAEALRVAGQHDAAMQSLAGLDSDDVLRFYGLFNLAVAPEQAPGQAIAILESLLALVPRDFEQRMLTERARIAIAELYLQEGRVAEARKRLAEVTANEQYGPYALAQLARLDMEAEQFENAAAIWHYLEQHYPWSRAATNASGGLGYAMLQARGEEAAYGVYLKSIDRIQEQQARLEKFRGRLTNDLQFSDWAPDISRGSGSQTLLGWLSAGFGHEEWTRWLSDGAVRHLAARWQSLETAHNQLNFELRNLEILLDVDTEQQRRVRAAEESIRGEGLDVATAQLQSKLVKRLEGLQGRSFELDDNLLEFALASEVALLAELKQLRKSNAAAHYESRLDRLEGLVRFAIHQKIPARKQVAISNLQQQLLTLEKTVGTVKRIQAAEAELAKTDSHSQQIVRLADEAADLEQRTSLALQHSRQTLIAGLTQLIDQDAGLLANQLHGLQYDMTRLIDRQVAEVSP